jgi:hypothetical protein
MSGQLYAQGGLPPKKECYLTDNKIMYADLVCT